MIFHGIIFLNTITMPISNDIEYNKKYNIEIIIYNLIQNEIIKYNNKKFIIPIIISLIIIFYNKSSDFSSSSFTFCIFNRSLKKGHIS